MRELFFNVVGFKIKFVLTHNPSDGPALTAAKRSFEKELLDYLSAFITDKKIKKPNYTVVVSSEHKLPEILKVEGPRVFIMALKSVSKHKIRTYYQIGIYQFHYLFYRILERLLSESNGFWLHSSSIFNGSSVDIFLGKSGAGKSTISRILSEKYIKLTDDDSFIRRRYSNYYFYDSPEIDKDWGSRKASRYSINNIYFIKKSPIFKIKKIGKEEALALVLKSSVLVNDSSVVGIMNFVENFNNFYYLYFANDKKKLLEFYSRINKSI